VQQVQLVSIRKILAASSLGLHAQEGLETEDSDGDAGSGFLKQGGAIFFLEVEWFGDEEVNGVSQCASL